MDTFSVFKKSIERESLSSGALATFKVFGFEL